MKIQFLINFKVDGNYGMNRLYAGVHWTVRKKQADYIHSLVQCEMYASGIPRRTLKKPVKVVISYNSKLDIDNHSYLSKLIVDAMKGYLIEDDNRKYVVELDQKFWDNEGILVEVDEKILK